MLHTNPMSASLKSLSIFVYSRSKVKVKYAFPTNEARNKCNTSFLCHFDWAMHFWNYFDHSRSSSMSKGQFQGQVSENTSNTRNMCNTSFSWDFDWEIHL